MNTYYDLDWDPDFPNPWWLGEVECETEPLDCRVFTYGVRQAMSGPLSVAVTDGGIALDLTFAAFSVPIVTREVGDIFEHYAPDAVQRLPVRVGDVPNKYEVLNVTRTVDALDRARAGYQLWKPEDGRPDKVGMFLQVHRMVFQRDMQPPPHLFRVKGWEIVLVVSTELMNALGGAGLRGNKFRSIEQ